MFIKTSGVSKKLFVAIKVLDGFYPYISFSLFKILLPGLFWGSKNMITGAAFLKVYDHFDC